MLYGGLRDFVMEVEASRSLVEPCSDKASTKRLAARPRAALSFLSVSAPSSFLTCVDRWTLMSLYLATLWEICLNSSP